MTEPPTALGCLTVVFEADINQARAYAASMAMAFLWLAIAQAEGVVDKVTATAINVCRVYGMGQCGCLKQGGRQLIYPVLLPWDPSSILRAYY